MRFELMIARWIRMLAALAILAGTPLAPRLTAAGNPEKTAALIAVLRSDAGLFEKARACQQLGEIGTPEAVPALAACLGDEHLGAYARSGLEGIPDPGAAAALRAALGQVKDRLLAGVVNSLGALRDPEAVGALSALARDPGAGVVKEALLALGRIATAESVQVIRQALEAGPEAHRVDAAAAGLLAAERQVAEGRVENAVALYEAVRLAKVPFAYRVGAARGVIVARKSGGADFLREQLRSEDRAIRNAALLAMREVPSDALASVLNEELETAAPERRLALITALMDCHNAASLAAVRARVGGEDPEIRVASLKVLGKIGGVAEAGVYLKVLADNRGPAEAALAMGQLGGLPTGEVDERILSTLAAARDAGLRVKLIRLLGDRGAAGAVGELLKQAGDPEAKVSIAACRALAVLAGPRELPALLTLIKARGDDAAREAAESAVVGVCARTGHADAGGEAVLAELRTGTVAADKNSWVRVLVALGYAKALPAIKAALDDANESVAANALEQLGRWPDPTPIDDLFGVVASGASPDRRQRALASAIQLASVAAEEQHRPNAVVAGWFRRAQVAARSVEERRRIISGLGRLAGGEGLPLLQPYLDDPSVRPEAAVAVIQTAKKLTRPEDRLGAKSLLEKIVLTNQDPAIIKQAQELIQRIPGKSVPVPAPGA